MILNIGLKCSLHEKWGHQRPISENGTLWSPPCLLNCPNCLHHLGLNTSWKSWFMFSMFRLKSFLSNYWFYFLVLYKALHSNLDFELIYILCIDLCFSAVNSRLLEASHFFSNQTFFWFSKPGNGKADIYGPHFLHWNQNLKFWVTWHISETETN